MSVHAQVRLCFFLVREKCIVYRTRSRYVFLPADLSTIWRFFRRSRLSRICFPEPSWRRRDSCGRPRASSPGEKLRAGVGQQSKKKLHLSRMISRTLFILPQEQSWLYTWSCFTNNCCAACVKTRFHDAHVCRIFLETHVGYNTN